LKRLLAGTLAAFALVPVKADSERIIDVQSPRRRTRPNRKSTRFIILHTTEADGPGTLECIARDGTASYVVDPDGRIFRIMKGMQVSVGCGRSMWNGLANLDNHSINIETIGFHNKHPSGAQIGSLRYLLRVLRRSYRVRGRDVMPHSQVAYGIPNRWHRRSHRGRKRCGMMFALDPVRKRLGLSEKPRYDPDVRAKRLIAADEYLEKVLYARMGKKETDLLIAQALPAIQDSGEENHSVKTVGEGQTVWEYAGDEYAYESTIYLFPDGMVKRGADLLKDNFDFHKVHPGTRIAVGYVYGGLVTRERTPFSIAGKNWNRPDTLYIMDGQVITGDEVSDKHIPTGTFLLFRK